MGRRSGPLQGEDLDLGGVVGVRPGANREAALESLQCLGCF